MRNAHDRSEEGRLDCLKQISAIQQSKQQPKQATPAGQHAVRSSLPPPFDGEVKGRVYAAEPSVLLESDSVGQIEAEANGHLVQLPLSQSGPVVGDYKR